jgi:hypothetical protein
MAFKQITRAHINQNEEFPNIFVAAHSSCLDVTDMSFKHNAVESSFFTTVPDGVVVFVFTPTNQSAYSTPEGEKTMRQLIMKGNWMFSPERGEGGMFEHTQIYIPGDKIHNLNYDGDKDCEKPESFGVFKVAPGDVSSPRQNNFVIDMDKQETTYDTDRLLQTIAPPKGSGVVRAVYIMSCSPHTIHVTNGSILKMQGRSNPPRNATGGYDSFAITPEVRKRVDLIEKKRFRCELFGKKLFWDHIQKSPFEPRFTRSMSVHSTKLDRGDSMRTLGLGMREVVDRKDMTRVFYETDDIDSLIAEKLKRLAMKGKC